MEENRLSAGKKILYINTHIYTYILYSEIVHQVATLPLICKCKDEFPILISIVSTRQEASIENIGVSGSSLEKGNFSLDFLYSLKMSAHRLWPI